MYACRFIYIYIFVCVALRGGLGGYGFNPSSDGTRQARGAKLCYIYICVNMCVCVYVCIHTQFQEYHCPRTDTRPPLAYHGEASFPYGATETGDAFKGSAATRAFWHWSRWEVRAPQLHGLRLKPDVYIAMRKAVLYIYRVRVTLKGALCAQVIRLRVSYTQNDETLSRNSLRYLSKANLPIAVRINP